MVDAEAMVAMVIVRFPTHFCCAQEGNLTMMVMAMWAVTVVAVMLVVVISQISYKW